MDRIASTRRLLDVAQKLIRQQLQQGGPLPPGDVVALRDALWHLGASDRSLRDVELNQRREGAAVGVGELVTAVERRALGHR